MPEYGPDILVDGTASASGVTGGETNAALKACDDDEGTKWYYNTAPPQWWKYDLGELVTKTVEKVRIKPYIGRLKDFKIQGSNNDSDWDDLYTGQHANNDGWEDYTFSNAVAYRYYMLYITTVYTDRVCIYEMEMMEEEAPPPPVISTAKSFVWMT